MKVLANALVVIIYLNKAGKKYKLHQSKQNETFKLLDRSGLATFPNKHYSISFLLPQFSFLKRKSYVNDNFAPTWYIYSLQLMNVLNVFY